MLIVKNKQALFNYEVSDNLICWIELFWHEVKSIRVKNVNIKSSYVSFLNWEMFVKNMNISSYAFAKNIRDFDSERPKKLLAKKKEIKKLMWLAEIPWNSIVVIAILLKNNFIKVEIWLWKWRKKYDKRQVLKQKDVDKRMRQVVKKSFLR